jgi:hypothetical protein
VWIFRAAIFVVPVVVFLVAGRVARELRASEAHPLRGWTGSVVRRTDDGGFAPVDGAAPEPAATAPVVPRASSGRDRSGAP